ncbi:PPOX class F420-dependent oxidoreductase [Micromonospora sp. NPDC001898]|uniref:PPOX class F420-dependent oxidoreductase n=1 Tax=Micromonospora sp. NPDC001898 TaxID=3364221 RepID=UPI0036BBC64A
MPFTAGKVAYLRSQSLGRPATIGGAGFPHCAPVKFTYNAGLGTIDITGREPTGSSKYRDTQANGRVTLIVDDIPPCSPFALRGLEIRAEADALSPADGPGGAELIRIHPVRIVARGIDAGWGARAVGRTVGATLAHEGGQR